MQFLSYRVCLLLCLTGSSLCLGDDLRPDPNWKGTVSDGLLMPSDWSAYWPTAKVGDFVVQKDKWGLHRDEVVEITKNTITVARVIDNVLGDKSRHTEVRTKYKVQLDKTQSTSPKGTGKSTGSKSKTKNSAKSPGTEVIKIGDQDIECTVRKSGKITHWYSPLVPFDGQVKKDAPDAASKFVVVDFGRGK